MSKVIMPAKFGKLFSVTIVKRRDTLTIEVVGIPLLYSVRVTSERTAGKLAGKRTIQYLYPPLGLTDGLSGKKWKTERWATLAAFHYATLNGYKGSILDAQSLISH